MLQLFGLVSLLASFLSLYKINKNFYYHGCEVFNRNL